MTDPVPVRDAATVVLLRDGADGGVEAWLLTRVRQMVFAGGMSVFPGGRLDAADAGVPMSDPDGAHVLDVARRFACAPELARALLAAAVRETFEETGVLLTVPAVEPSLDSSLDLAAARTRVEAGEVGFGDLLAEHGLAADAAALLPWSRWVTPEGEVRRYDTRFFVGALPAGAEARDVTTESSSADWVPVGAALEQAGRGERGLLPPTALTLAELHRYSRVADVLAAARTREITETRPVLRIADDGSVSAELPDGTVLPVPRALIGDR